MISFKQALNQLKAHWSFSLFIGAFCLCGAILFRYAPYVSAFLTAFLLLVSQLFCDKMVSGQNWKDLAAFKKALLPLIITSAILFPSTVLFGSSIGILQSPQEILSGAPMALLLFILATFFYLLLSHALRYRLETDTLLVEAIDVVGLTAVKNFRAYFTLSFYLGLLFLLSGIAWGLGFIVAFPLLFYTSHYSYVEMKTSAKFIKKVKAS